MAKSSGSEQNVAASAHLLDGNVLYALIDEAHVHHAPARHWFSQESGAFATCPITQGTLLRLVMRLGGQSVGQALALLGKVTAHPRHQIWPDMLPYDQVQWQGVMGHRQVPNAYLAGLARHHGGKLVSFDQGAGCHASGRWGGCGRLTSQTPRARDARDARDAPPTCRCDRRRRSR